VLGKRNNGHAEADGDDAEANVFQKARRGALRLRDPIPSRRSPERAGQGLVGFRS
jgi:hypothetical protein